MKPSYLAASVGLLLAAAGVAADGSLRVLFTEAGAPPLYETNPAQPGKLNGGFIKDFGDLLASTLGTSATFVETTRSRIEWRLSEGHADMVCNANPAWYSTAKLLQWTTPIFGRVEVVVSRADDRWAPRGIDDLAGHRLGVIQGYRYPQLDQGFASGAITRHDQPNLKDNFAQLDLQLIDGLVTTRDEAMAYLAKQGNAGRYRIGEFPISKVVTYCAVSPQSRWAIQDINLALRRMQDNGQLPALRKRYNLDAP